MRRLGAVAAALFAWWAWPAAAATVFNCPGGVGLDVQLVRNGPELAWDGQALDTRLDTRLSFELSRLVDKSATPETTKPAKPAPPPPTKTTLSLTIEPLAGAPELRLAGKRGPVEVDANIGEQTNVTLTGSGFGVDGATRQYLLTVDGKGVCLGRTYLLRIKEGVTSLPLGALELQPEVATWTSNPEPLCVSSNAPPEDHPQLQIVYEQVDGAGDGLIRLTDRDLKLALGQDDCRGLQVAFARPLPAGLYGAKIKVNGESLKVLLAIRWSWWVVVGIVFAAWLLSTLLRLRWRYYVDNAGNDERIRAATAQVRDRPSTSFTWDELSARNALRAATAFNMTLTRTSSVAAFVDQAIAPPPQRSHPLTQAIINSPTALPIAIVDQIAREMHHAQRVSRRSEVPTIADFVGRLEADAKDGFRQRVYDWLRAAVPVATERATSCIAAIDAAPTMTADHKAWAKNAVSALVTVLQEAFEQAERADAGGIRLEADQVRILDRVLPTLDEIAAGLQPPKTPFSMARFRQISFLEHAALVPQPAVASAAGRVTLAIDSHSPALDTDASGKPFCHVGEETIFCATADIDPRVEAFCQWTVALKTGANADVVAYASKQLSYVFAQPGTYRVTVEVKRQTDSTVLASETLLVECGALRPVGSARRRELTFRFLVSMLALFVAIGAALTTLWAGKPFGGSIKDVFAAIGVGLGADLGVASAPTIWSSILEVLRGKTKEGA